MALRHTDRPVFFHGIALGVICLVAWGAGGCGRSSHAVPDGGSRVLNIYNWADFAAAPFVDPALRRDPAVYPPPEVRKNLYLPEEVTPDYERLRTRVWTHIKTGQ